MLYAQLESRVQTCLDELVKSGKAVGLQAAVVHRGELVAEAWSGHRRYADGKAGGP